VLVARHASEDERPGPRPVRVPALLASASEPAQAGLMPDLRGLGARDALRTLTQIGMSARMTGDGFVVAQSPEPGAALVHGAACLLSLGRRPPVLRAGGTPQ